MSAIARPQRRAVTHRKVSKQSPGVLRGAAIGTAAFDYFDRLEALDQPEAIERQFVQALA